MKKSSFCLCIMTLAMGISCTDNEISENRSDNSSQQSLIVSRQITPEQSENALFIQGIAIVKFSEQMAESIEKGTATKAVSSMPEELGMKIGERVFPYAGEYEERTRREGLHRFYYVEFDKALSYSSASGMISRMEGVENVEPCRKASTMTFNDSSLRNQWGFTGTYDINVLEAWEYTTGNPDVIVCVVDEGIQQDHPDLKWNLSDDNYNFVKKSKTINGGDHGTHVAGVIGGVSNNGAGIAGIAGGNYSAGKRGITLQSAQVFDGNSSASDFGAAIKWGADHGAVISQNSWGYDFDWNDDGQLTGEELEAAMAAEVPESDKAAIDYFIKYAGCDNDGNQKADSPMKGGVVVFAAGNDGIENGIPGKYEPVIAVGATTSSGILADFSNWGDWVDICAPGSYILSTITSSKYGYMSGTSMACPHVSGACALLVSLFGGQGFTNELLNEILINGANSSRINYNSRTMGPYLDLKGSIEYGIQKIKREDNKDPEIKTDLEGDIVMRQYQTISIPFTISDPDGDNVQVTAELEGHGEFVQDTKDLNTWYFNLTGELVNDFTTKKATITAKDIYGGETTYTFNYRVIKNNAPKATGSLDDIIIIGTGTSKTISLAGLFTDEDGETLTLAAKDLVDAPAKFKLEGESLTITPNNYGSSTMTVSATDKLKEKASVKFRYVVRYADVEMDFYPNPVRDYLHVRTGVKAEETHITLENATGNVVYDETLQCSVFEPAEINMKEFAPGMYTLRVSFGGKTYVNNVAKR